MNVLKFCQVGGVAPRRRHEGGGDHELADLRLGARDVRVGRFAGRRGELFVFQFFFS